MQLIGTMSILFTIMPQKIIATDRDTAAQRMRRRRRRTNVPFSISARGTGSIHAYMRADLIDPSGIRYSYELHDVFDQFKSPQ